MFANPGAKLTNSENAVTFVRDILPGVAASMKTEWRRSNIPRAVLHDKASYFVHKRSDRHAKTCLQSFPKLSPARPQTLQNQSPGRPGEPKKRSTSAERHPRVPKSRPRSAREGASAAQERPKARQVAPRSCPGGTQSPPKPSPGSPKTSF